MTKVTPINSTVDFWRENSYSNHKTRFTRKNPKNETFLTHFQTLWSVWKKSHLFSVSSHRGSNRSSRIQLPPRSRMGLARGLLSPGISPFWTSCRKKVWSGGILHVCLIWTLHSCPELPLAWHPWADQQKGRKVPA